MAWFSVLSCIWLCAALARLQGPLAAASTPSRAAKPMIKAPLYSLQLLPVCRCREPGAARPSLLLMTQLQEERNMLDGSKRAKAAPLQL